MTDDNNARSLPRSADGPHGSADALRMFRYGHVPLERIADAPDHTTGMYPGSEPLTARRRGD